VLAVMGVLFIAAVIACYAAEAHGNHALNALGLTGGNMEGKEMHFGIAASSLSAVITTAASCDAVNAMHDSFTALGGMIPLIEILERWAAGKSASESVAAPRRTAKPRVGEMSAKSSAA
jgi:K+-transporting ATPase ATPase A chain